MPLTKRIESQTCPTFRFCRQDVGKPFRKLGRGDCTVRALTIAAGIAYPLAWQLLYDAQRRYFTCGFDICDFLKQEPAAFGVVGYVSFPAMRNQRRITARTFVEKFPQGNFILSMAHHVAAVENAVLYDSWDSSRRCVYAAWEIDPDADAFAVTRRLGIQQSLTDESDE